MDTYGGGFQKAVFLKLKWFHNAMALDLVITSFVVCIHTHSVLCIVYDGSCHVLFAKLKVLGFFPQSCVDGVQYSMNCGDYEKVCDFPS